MDFWNILLNNIDTKALLLVAYSILKVLGIIIFTRILWKFGAIIIDQLFKDRLKINEHLRKR